MKRIILIFLFLWASCGNLMAATYYVKNGGDDSADGLSDVNAWATIAKVNSYSSASGFHPGDTICFAMGSVWRETLAPLSSGTSSNYITYTKYGSGNLPIIKASDNVIGVAGDWTEVRSNIWSKAMTTECKMIYFDSDSMGIEEATPDAQYEWDWVSNEVFVYATENPVTYYSLIEAGQRNYAMNGGAQEYINLDGMQFEHSNRYVLFISNHTKGPWNVKNCTLKWSKNNVVIVNDDSTIEDNIFIGVGLWVHDDASGCTIKGNEISYNRNSGLSFSGDSNTVQGNTIHHNWYNGIFVFGIATDNIVEGNELFTNGQALAVGDGTQRLEIYSSGANTNTYINNLIRDGSIIGEGSAGIYLDDGSENNLIYNNTIVNMQGDFGYGLVVENGLSKDENHRTQNNIFKNNLIYNCARGIALADDMLSYQGNIWNYNFFNTTTQMVYDSYGGAVYQTVAEWYTATGFGENSRSGDPLINGDYTLQAASSCVDAGTNVGITKDYLGVFRINPDIGAYEYVSGATDTTAPSAVNNLNVSGTTTSTVTLSWSASGDDGISGTAASYDIRYNTQIITDSNWDTSTQISIEPMPSSAGTTESMTVSGLTSGRIYYFAMKASDEVPNTSVLSNVASGTTATVPDTTPPYTTGHSPAKGATNIPPNTPIIVHVKDDGAVVDINAIVMRVNGQAVTPTITGTPADYKLTYMPLADFNYGSTVAITVEAQDLAP